MWITYLFRGHNYCQNFIAPIVLSGQQNWPWAMILSSRNNLNMGNTFVDLMEQLVQSNSDNSYVP